MKAIASVLGRTIEVMRHSHAWSFDVEAVKKSRTYAVDAKLIVKSGPTFAHIKALRLNEGRVRPCRVDCAQGTAGRK